MNPSNKTSSENYIGVGNKKDFGIFTPISDTSDPSRLCDKCEKLPATRRFDNCLVCTVCFIDLTEAVKKKNKAEKSKIYAPVSRELDGNLHACSACGMNFKSRIELTNHLPWCEEFQEEQANDALARMEGTRRTNEK